ncbi:hypothetical protein BSLG_006301 [Batrachochytrium salamandrivorans]|nr:hypothetical protein BSLG_006301 [Batrachochytrium salamandrivorans]
MDDNTHVPSSRVMSSPTFQQQRQQMNPEPSQHSSWTQAPLAPLLEPTSPSLATTIPFELRDQHQQQNHHHHHQQQQQQQQLQNHHHHRQPTRTHIQSHSAHHQPLYSPLYASSPTSPHVSAPRGFLFSAGQPSLTYPEHPAYLTDYNQAQQEHTHPYQQSPLPSCQKEDMPRHQPPALQFQSYSSTRSPAPSTQHHGILYDTQQQPHLSKSQPSLKLSLPGAVSASHSSPISPIIRTDRWPTGGPAGPSHARHVSIPTRVASASTTGPERSATISSHPRLPTATANRSSSTYSGQPHLSPNLRRNVTDSDHYYSESANNNSAQTSNGPGPSHVGDNSHPDVSDMDLSSSSKGNRVTIPSRGDSRQKDRAEDLQIPSRNASKQKTSIDDLLNSGLSALASPRFDMRDAIKKWNEALTIADRERDLFRKAKAQSNIGCTLRNAGHVLNARTYLEASWDSTVDYIRTSSTKYPSNWLQIAIRALDLEGDQVEEAFVTSSESILGNRPSSIRSNGSNTSSGPALNANSGGGANGRQPTSSGSVQQEPAQGPPIIIWLMQLTTNLGNVYFSNGEYESAIQKHESCKRLVEVVLEEYPLPEDLVQAIRSPASESNALLSSAPFIAPNGASHSSTSHAQPSASKQYRLSYLHRQALLAQARSLTHLGVCFGALGLTASSLQHHMAASTLLSTITSSIPALAGTGHLAPTRSTSKSQLQVGLIEITSIQAAVAANVGTAWHAAGELGKAIEWHERGFALFSNVWSQPVISASLAAHRSPSRYGIHSTGDLFQNSSVRQSVPAQPDSSSSAALLPRSIDETRQLANLGALYIDVGRSINSMDWLGTIHSDPSSNAPLPQRDHGMTDTSGRSSQYLEMKELQQYWRSPVNEHLSGAPHDGVPEVARECTEPLFDRGLGMLYGQASNARQLRDWGTLYSIWINMASAYLLLHRPVLALHYLSLLVPAANNDFVFGLDMIFEDSRLQPPVPKGMHASVIFVLAHCIFSLSRFPAGAAISANLSPDRALNWNLGSSRRNTPYKLDIPSASCDRIHRLMQVELGVDLQIDLQAPTEEMAMAILRQSESSLMALVEMRHTPTLFPVLLDVAALLRGGNDTQGHGVYPNFVPSGASHVPGNLRADSLKRLLANVHLTIAKTAWVLAGSYTDVDKPIRRMWFEQARRALEQTVSGTFMDRAGDGQSIHRLFGDISVASSPSHQGFVRGMLSDLLSAMGDHLDMHLGNQLDVGRPLVDGYLGPSTFATVVDLLRFAQYLGFCKSSEEYMPSDEQGMDPSEALTPQSAEQEFGLFKILGVPERTASTIIHALVNAAMTLYESQIGACGTCLPILVESLKSDAGARCSLGPKVLTLGLGNADSVALPYAFSVLFRHQQNGDHLSDAASLRPHAVLPCPHHHHNLQINL